MLPDRCENKCIVQKYGKDTKINQFIQSLFPLLNSLYIELLADEIEKMKMRDQTSLLNLMESGILSELKYNQKRTTQLKTWVFVSGNSTDRLLPPLLTRFRDIYISNRI